MAYSLASLIIALFISACEGEYQNMKTPEDIAAEAMEMDPSQLQSKLMEQTVFPRARFFRVLSRELPPRSAVVAVTAENTTVINSRSNFREFMSGPPHSAQDAMEVINVFLRLTRPHARWVSRTKDIPGISEGEALAWQKQLQSPQIKGQNSQFVATGWLWENGEISFISITVNGDGISAATSESKPLGIHIVTE